jgi:transcriptional regulator with XRE-family HTH domain
MAATNDGPGVFGVLLHELRVAAGLSQEELAEKAGLSRRGISDLERGARRVPHPATVRSLADALGLDGADRVRLLTRVHASTQSAPRGDSTTDKPSGMTTLDTQSHGVPLVGRVDEWQQLLSCWHAAANGAPGLVILGGEPGIGKTRLAEELLTWARGHGAGTAAARAYAAEGNLSYGPVADWLRSETLRDAVRGLDDTVLAWVARLLPELLTNAPNHEPEQGNADPRQRQLFFRSLAQATLSTDRPLLLVLDDPQWCDRDTLEWLHFLLRFDSGAALQIVGTLRTAEVDPQHPLISLLVDLRRTGQVTEIPLGPLRRSEVNELATAIAGRELEAVELARLLRRHGRAAPICGRNHPRRFGSRRDFRGEGIGRAAHRATAAEGACSHCRATCPAFRTRA